MDHRYVVWVHSVVTCFVRRPLNRLLRNRLKDFVQIDTCILCFRPITPLLWKLCLFYHKGGGLHSYISLFIWSNLVKCSLCNFCVIYSPIAYTYSMALSMGLCTVNMGVVIFWGPSPPPGDVFGRFKFPNDSDLYSVTPYILSLPEQTHLI